MDKRIHRHSGSLPKLKGGRIKKNLSYLTFTDWSHSIKQKFKSLKHGKKNCLKHFFVFLKIFDVFEIFFFLLLFGKEWKFFSLAIHIKSSTFCTCTVHMIHKKVKHLRLLSSHIHWMGEEWSLRSLLLSHLGTVADWEKEMGKTFAKETKIKSQSVLLLQCTVVFHWTNTVKSRFFWVVGRQQKVYKTDIINKIETQ